MNGLCNLDNVVYQAIIHLKKDINDRKSYIGISSTNWKIRYGNINFPSPMSIKKIKLLYLNIIGDWKVKGWPLTFNGPYWKDLIPLSLSIVGAICVLRKKIHILLFPEPKKLLNKRSELIARCRHRAKFKP